MKRVLLKEILSYDDLKDLYISKNLSTRNIAELYKCNPNTVQNLLKFYDIKKDKSSLYASRTRNTKKTYMEKYGVENNSQLKEWKNQVKETCKEKYGVDNVSQIQEVKDKIKETCKKKYGVNNISQYPINKEIVKEAVRQTCMERYGVPYFTLMPECYSVCNKSISRINKWWENKLQDYGYNTILEYRISNRLYDIYIQETNYLLEVNPTHCHNSCQNLIKDSNKPKSKDYHYQKSKLATENEYHCIHIWNWDDTEKILNLFKRKEKLYARKVDTKQVSVQEANNFNNLYHLQGTCKGQKVIYGLYYEDQLVSLMSFGKPRYNKNYQWELLRYTTHPDYMIIGGAEKLFKYFTENFQPDNVLTYCDYSKFSGHVYNKLGFELIKRTQPSCHWSLGKQHITQAQLSKYGFDKLLGRVYGYYGKGTDNQQLMLEHGFLPVYDCGQLVFGWVNKFAKGENEV